MDNSLINKITDNIKILSIAMVEKAKSGHPGGAMGGACFINILYSEFLKFNPANPDWLFRDRFFLDPGHMSALLYSILTLFGKFTIEEIMNFRQWKSTTPGHPELNIAKGIENTSGPLGQGHVMAVGSAIAEKFLAARFGEWMSHKIYTYISDGGIQEEISQGAARIAGHLGLDNLIMFYDSNDVQLSTNTCEVTSEDTALKYKSWDWHVITINGNEPDEIRVALREANAQKDRPTLIIGKTTIGKGAVTDRNECFEGKYSTHGQPLSKSGASFEKTVENLGGDPKNPFLIFPESIEYFNKAKEEKIKYVNTKNEEYDSWKRENPELSFKLDKFFSNEISGIDFTEIIHKENIATRSASGDVLSYFSKKIENMIVASADLCNSDKTDSFLKNTTVLRKGDFTGAFLQAGVSEFTMAAIANGIALHGGVIPVCGTFFVFSDYMKPAVRLASLMELPVKYVWTHDSFRVGEDGPTHQPVEHEAQIRLLEQLKNHSGKKSLLALRPADAAETTVAWEMALRNTECPTALILSRQNIEDIPAKKDSSRDRDAQGAKKGAYIVRDTINPPCIILIGNGSEVSVLIKGAEILENKKGLSVRVVSAISEGLFRDQSIEYQNEILPDNIPKLGFTAGLPITLKGLTGTFGKVYGMESFGYSAPAEILDEILGFTPENVYRQAEIYLDEYKRMTSPQ